MTAIRHGFDGEGPIFEIKRGSEVRDRLTGAIVREGEMSKQNLNVDRLEWLLAHKRIDVAQHAAGRRLQLDCEMAQIGGYTTLEGGKGGCGTNRLSDVKLDAMSRHGAAHAAAGNIGSLILRLVVEENKSLEKAGALMRVSGKAVALGLQMALDAVARFYELA